MTCTVDSKLAPKRQRRMAREPETLGAGPSPQPKRQTKTAEASAMLARPDGATLDQLVIATGWLPHTARAALTGLKKKGHKVTSDKPAGGVRIYPCNVGRKRHSSPPIGTRILPSWGILAT